jgi:hypothetical protein
VMPPVAEQKSSQPRKRRRFDRHAGRTTNCGPRRRCCCLGRACALPRTRPRRSACAAVRRDEYRRRCPFVRGVDPPELLALRQVDGAPADRLQNAEAARLREQCTPGRMAPRVGGISVGVSKRPRTCTRAALPTGGLPRYPRSRQPLRTSRVPAVPAPRRLRSRQLVRWFVALGPLGWRPRRETSGRPQTTKCPPFRPGPAARAAISPRGRSLARG